MAGLVIFKAEDDATQEYRALLSQLDEEAEDIKQRAAVDAKRDKAIKKQVGEICDNLGGQNVRVVVETDSGRAWDRRVGTRGAGVDPALLEKELGIEQYRKLLCDRVVDYVLNPTKLEEARKHGKITDRVIAKATVKGTPSASFYRPKMAEVKDDGS